MPINNKISQCYINSNCNIKHRKICLYYKKESNHNNYCKYDSYGKCINFKAILDALKEELNSIKIEQNVYD